MMPELVENDVVEWRTLDGGIAVTVIGEPSMPDMQSFTNWLKYDHEEADAWKAKIISITRNSVQIWPVKGE